METIQIYQQEEQPENTLKQIEQKLSLKPNLAQTRHKRNKKRNGTKNTQNELLLQNLMEFYKNPNHLAKMVKIINGESYISLRIIDWFVTNFAKKYFTSYWLPIFNSNKNAETEYELFNIYINYKLNLKSYSKHNFDPFCRSARILIPYNNENNMETTVGQLNFFKWAIENKILDFIETNYDTIEADMNSRNVNIDTSNIISDKTQKTRKKRQELTLSACKCIKKENINIKIKFH